MKTLEEKIVSWMTRHAGVQYVITFTGIGLYSWKCTITTHDGTEWARGNGENELQAKHRAFSYLFAQKGTE